MNLEQQSSILVTGANGYVGRNLCARLQREGKRVRALLRGDSTGPWNESVKGDLASSSLPSDLMSDVDTVFHLAGKAHALTEKPGEDAGYRQINLKGTEILLEAAKSSQVKRFVFFSSVKAMGEGGDAVIDEDCSLPPETPYGRSKLEAEKRVLEAAESIPHVVILRPSMIYGPQNPGNLKRMIRAVRKGFFPPLPKLSNQRSMVHVEDVVEASLLVMKNQQSHLGIYILTDGQTYTTRQIYEWICAALNKPVPSWYVPLVLLRFLARTGDVIGAIGRKRFMFDSEVLRKLTGSSCYSSNKIRKDFGFSQKWTLEDALPSIVGPLVL